MQYRLILVWSFVAGIVSWVGMKEMDLYCGYSQAARVKKKNNNSKQYRLRLYRLTNK